MQSKKEDKQNFGSDSKGDGEFLSFQGKIKKKYINCQEELIFFNI